MAFVAVQPEWFHDSTYAMGDLSHWSGSPVFDISA
jgi:hypothetical protein